MSTVKAISAPKAAAEKPQRKQSEFRRSIKLISRFIAGQRGVFGMAMFMLVLESLTSIGAKLPLKWLLDYLDKGFSTQPIADDFAATFALFPAPVVTAISQFFLGLSSTGVLVFLSVAVLLFALLNSISDSATELYLVRGGRQLGFTVRDRLYAHLQKLSLAFFGKQRTGDLLARVTGDVTALEEFAVKSLKDIAGSIFIIVLTLLMLFITNWQMGLIAIVTVPILSLASNYFADQIKTASKKQRAQEGALAAAAQEMLTSIRVIQVYGSAGDQQKRFAETSKQAMDIAVRVGRLQAYFGGAISLLQSVVVVIIIWVAVALVSGGLLTVGTTVVFILWIQDLFKPTKRIIKQWNEVGKIMASAERISEVLDRRPAVEDSPDSTQAPAFKGHVEFKDVSFAYMPEPEDVKEGAGPVQPRLALRAVSFDIKPGEVVALVGGSGAGKSTIVQLLPRLYDPHAGAITIDGLDIRSVTLDSLRSRMSMVLQEAILFTGTVAENISYGRQNATREEIIAAAMQASAHEFIQQLPEGYDTVLSERASNLSGGQRQRIAIARAFIRNTPILILDEPTTGLDAESTELVLLALRELIKGKATLIISHDLNLIRQADKIIAIKDGQIQQVGTHRELLKQGGLYADLYNKQFGQAAEEFSAKPAPAPAPVPLPADTDDEEVDTVTPRAFQTLIGKALPAPVTPKAFQTLMMQAVPPPPPAQPAAQPAAVKPLPVQPAQAAQPAAVKPLPVQPAQPAPSPAPAPQPIKPLPSQAAKPAQPAAQPAAVKPMPVQAAPSPAPAPQPIKPLPSQAAKPAQPAAQPAAVKPMPVQPAQAAVKPAPAQPASSPAPAPQAATPQPAPAAPDQAAKPKPAIFETTVMHTIPEAATGRTELYPAQADTPDAARETPAPQPAPPTTDSLPSPHATLGHTGLRGERLDLLNSAVLQSELPALKAAFDAAIMGEQIQSVLFGKARPHYTVERCVVDQATYLPGEGVAIRYEVTVRDRRSQATLEPLVAGMVFPNQLSCALYMRDKLAPLVELTRGRPELAPFATPAAMVEPLNMALHVFPIDGELPALVPATDPKRMREVFNETLPAALGNSLEIEKCDVELVDYARRYRAVLRYQIEGRRPGSSRVEQQTVYGKVFTSNVGALAGPVTAALRERLLNNNGDYRFDVPRALGWRPDMQLSLLEAIPGKPLISDLLKARLRGRATEPEMLSLRQMIDACAQIAARLHTSDIHLGRRRTLDDEMAMLRKNFAEMRRLSPDLGAQLESWLDQLSIYAEQSDSLRLGFCHGDYTYTQVIFDGQQAGLVDFDSICQAEPALDIGHFLAYLRVAGFKAQKLADGAPNTLVEELSERFLTNYIGAMGDRVEDVERLRVRVAIYQMISLLRRALRSWQKFKGSRLENALVLIEEEMACLPHLDY
jgi:ABC-type multidrug transport system fused ATPase/permease subunit